MPVPWSRTEKCRRCLVAVAFALVVGCGPKKPDALPMPRHEPAPPVQLEQKPDPVPQVSNSEPLDGAAAAQASELDRWLGDIQSRYREAGDAYRNGRAEFGDLCYYDVRSMTAKMKQEHPGSAQAAQAGEYVRLLQQEHGAPRNPTDNDLDEAHLEAMRRHVETDPYAGMKKEEWDALNQVVGEVLAGN